MGKSNLRVGFYALYMRSIGNRNNLPVDVESHFAK